MGSKNPIAGQVARQACIDFPKTPSLTLAKKIYKDNKAVFVSLNSAYTAVRYYRGAHGTKSRAQAISAGTIVEEKPEPTRTPFDNLPEALTEFEEWSAVEVSAERVLLLTDIHIPFHVKDPLVRAMRHGKDVGVDTIILGGDFADFYACSFWEKDPRRRNFANEIKAVRQFLGVLREMFHNAQIIAKIGNHEERWERYLRVKAPEILGLEELEYAKILHLDNYGISLVGDKRAMKLGKLFVAHGHEWGEGISSPVNPARGYYMRAKTHMIGGHYHQPSSHSEKSLDQTVLSTWSTGCLCNLHPAYRPMNKWSHGFADIEVASDGNFEVHNHKIINDRIYAA